MSRWFRLYDEMLDDPKVQRLHPALFKVLINLWCVASRNDGRLPSATDLSFSLRMTEDETFRAVSKLADAGFIDTDPATSEQRPHGWDARQFRSDTSTDRVRAHRERRKTKGKPDNTPPAGGSQGNGDETFHGTGPEQRQNRADNSVTDVTGTIVPHPAMDFVKAVFDGGIRLLQRDDPDLTERAARSVVGRWRKSVTDAELITILMEAETKSQSLEWIMAAVETRNGTRTRQPAVQQAANGLRGPRPDPAIDLLRQAQAERAAGLDEDEGGDSQAWPSLPSYLAN